VAGGVGAFLNYAASSRLHPAARRAIREALEAWPLSFEEEARVLREARVLFARLIGADPGEVALVPNVTAAISAVAYGLPLSPRRRVLTNSLEFPTNRFAWMTMERLGYRVEEVEMEGPLFDESRLLDSLSGDEALVALSHVFYQSGYRVDLDSIYPAVRASGSLLFLDAYQSVGVVRVSASQADFIATGSGKWLMSIPGSGFLYVRRGVLEGMRPPFMGWMSTEDPGDVEARVYRPAPDARRLEGGFPPILGYVGVNAVLREMLRTGIGEIERRVLSLTGWLIDELSRIRGVRVVTPSDPRRRAGIVSFAGDFDPRKMGEYLASRGIVVSVRGGMVRASVHYVTSEEEVEALLSAVREFLSGV